MPHVVDLVLSIGRHRLQNLLLIASGIIQDRIALDCELRREGQWKDAILVLLVEIQRRICMVDGTDL